ncbi:hypothetical protein, partial [Sulfuracidifex metallicus]|uniref:hypothetical protein n=1 Tax=Sulfuracidifex metallicus TaxID=47303 RepID=UPI0022745C6A
GAQSVNITNSQLDMNLSNVSVQVPVLAPENVILASHHTSETLSNVSYIYVQIKINPYSMVKLLQIYAHANSIYRPLVSVGDSGCVVPSSVGINNPSCGYDSLLHQWNSIWSNTGQYSHIYPSNASDLNWSGGLHVSIYGSTTGSWVNTNISHFVELTRIFNPPLILLNNGSTTTSYYITFEEANGQNQGTYWIFSVMFSVAYGSASYTIYDSVSTTSSSGGGGGCFAEDTLFLVERNGVKKIMPIKDIQVGDKVWNGDEFVIVREKFDEGYQTVYNFDNLWITETQPICLPTEKDNYVCQALKELIPIKALEKRENVHVYDLTVDKYLLKPVLAKFRYGDVFIKS